MGILEYDVSLYFHVECCIFSERVQVNLARGRLSLLTVK